MTIKGGQKKIGFFLTIIAVVFFFLVGRLYYLQIIHGKSYLQRSESNFIQERLMKHSRGRILASDGRILADNRLAYDVYVTFAMLPDSLKNLRAIVGSFNVAKKDLLAMDKELLDRAHFTVDDNVVVREDATPASCAQIAETVRTAMIAGVSIESNGIDGHCQVSINTGQFPSHSQTFNQLAALLGVSRETLLEPWQKAQKKAFGLGKFKPSLLMSDVGFDAYAKIENAISLGTLAGITVVPSKRRRYVYGDFATHNIGILNQVSIADLQANKGYRAGDFIGRSGLEASFEDVLRGSDGVERVVVDAKGRRFDETWEASLLGSDRIIEGTPGNSIKLSLDWEMQKAAQEVFLGTSGSVIVADVNTGFILAMASFPSFDPNVLVSADNIKYFRGLLADKTKPLRNKAVQDHYSPGSIFKPITAIAGLSKKLITPFYQHNCTGTYQIHRTVWRCFNREGHGPISLVEALKASCDGYFYELGHRLGLDALADVAKKLGIGAKTEIALIGETSGILPTKEYYRKRFGYVAPGFVVNMSIGQGDLSVSPIQMAMIYGAIANGGVLYRPQLVKEIINDQGEVIKRFDPHINSSVADSSFNFDEIVHGLSFVAEPGGSAYSLRYRQDYRDISKWLLEEKISIVGKTGTAQVVKLSKSIKHLLNVAEVPYEQRDHAWFVGLFPEHDPKIVVVVMTEHGGFGSSISAPVAVRLMKKWHEKNRVTLAATNGD